MKVITLAVLAIATAMSAPASSVTVYVQGLSVVPGQVLSRAQGLANEMFASVDVNIDWRRGGSGHSPSRTERAIVVEMTIDPHRELTPGPLAFSLPYEGVHITVFYDRVRQRAQPDSIPNLLAHVLVHEITHILEGTDAHAATGIMKARWDEKDLMQMRNGPLSFAEQDVRLIALRLAQDRGAGTLITAIRH